MRFGFAMSLALCLGLGCNGDDEDEGPGNVAAIGMDWFPWSLNPILDEEITNENIGQCVSAGVFEAAPTGELIPGVVTELPTVANGGVTANEDGTVTIQYQIREDAVWADGVPITGEDLLFTYQTIMDPTLMIWTEGYDQIIPESVEVDPTDSKLFRYTLQTPSLVYKALFHVIIPKHDVDGSDFENEWNERMWVSGGPFQFVSWEDGILELERNENYWRTDPDTGDALPYLDGVLFHVFEGIVPGDAVFEAQLGSDEGRPARSRVDVKSLPFELTADLVQSLEDQGAEVLTVPGPMFEHLEFQFGPNNRNPLSQNQEVAFRRAVAHAIDRQRIVDDPLVTGGLASPSDSYVDAFDASLSQGAWSQYDYDPDLAEELAAPFCADADEDGSPDCKVIFSTVVYSPPRVRISELLGEMMADAGIPYEAQLEEDFFGETLDEGSFDLGEWAWVGSPGLFGAMEFHWFYHPEMLPPEGPNYARWGPIDRNEHTARYAEIIEDMHQTVDEEELADLVHEAEQILADRVVIIPLYQRVTGVATDPREVEGIAHNPHMWGTFTWEVERWKKPDHP